MRTHKICAYKAIYILSHYTPFSVTSSKTIAQLEKGSMVMSSINPTTMGSDSLMQNPENQNQTPTYYSILPIVIAPIQYPMLNDNKYLSKFITVYVVLVLVLTMILGIVVLICVHIDHDETNQAKCQLMKVVVSIRQQSWFTGKIPICHLVF